MPKLRCFYFWSAHRNARALINAAHIGAGDWPAIWNNSPDLLAIANFDGKYLIINPAWTEILGWSEWDLLGRSSQWLLHPDDRERTHAELAHLARSRKPLRLENRLRDKNGSYHWVSW